MVAIVAFNILMLALCAAVGGGIVPPAFVRSMLAGLHNTIGITVPPAGKERLAALMWIGWTIVTADGALFMLVFLMKRLM
ncbi:MAG: hypothetical protein ACRD3Q_01095 [Terriglobales bacterium]